MIAVKDIVAFVEGLPPGLVHLPKTKNTYIYSMEYHETIKKAAG